MLVGMVLWIGLLQVTWEWYSVQPEYEMGNLVQEVWRGTILSCLKMDNNARAILRFALAFVSE